MRRTRLELELGGKVRPLLFDHLFFEMVTETQTLSDLDDLNANKPWRYVPTLALAALKSGADFENKKDKFSYEEVARWCAEIDDPMTLNQIPEAYKTALGFIYHANTGRDLLAEAEKRSLQSQSISTPS